MAQKPLTSGIQTIKIQGQANQSQIHKYNTKVNVNEIDAKKMQQIY